MEAQLSDELYLRFRDLLQLRSGLSYPEPKRADLLHGLRMAMTTGGHTSLEELYAAVMDSELAWDHLVTHLTIGETYFFRNRPQFDALRQHILPDIIGRRADIRWVRVWSAGCATGEEPYSLAITFSEELSDPSWNFSILATDINSQFLARANEALYGDWSFRETPADIRARYWVQEQNRWRLRPEMRRVVSFSRLNLAEPCYPAILNGTTALDLILCRNVTIYFDAATTRQVVARFYDALAPGGWLIVGHAEPQASVYHQFETHNFPDTVVYRKPLNAPLFASEPACPAGSSTPARTPQPPGALPMRTLAATASASNSQERRRPARLEPAEPQVAAPKRDDKIGALLSEAQRCADRGDWAAAEHHCAQALECDRLCVAAHYLLAQIYEHEGKLDAALGAYRRTVYLERGFVLGLIGMANIWRQLGRIADAQRYYQNALKHVSQLDPIATVPGAGGASAHELAALIEQQLHATGAYPAHNKI